MSLISGSDRLIQAWRAAARIGQEISELHSVMVEIGIFRFLQFRAAAMAILLLGCRKPLRIVLLSLIFAPPWSQAKLLKGSRRKSTP